MKTNLLKVSMAFIALFLVSEAYSQSYVPKKTCINIREINDGKVTIIDTCFKDLTDKEVQKKLNEMGLYDVIVNNMEDSTKIIINKVINIANSAANKIIIIDDQNGSVGNYKSSAITGSQSKAVVVQDNAHSYTISSDSDGSIQTEIIVNSGKNEGDSSRNEIKVIVFHTIMVNDVSDSDKWKIRNDVTAATVPFSNLKVYPNPVQSALMLSYSSLNSEPLQITIYDENGKTVYTENVNATGGEVNKTISLNGYAPGIYFINLLQGNQQETKKIIVRK